VLSSPLNVWIGRASWAVVVLVLGVVAMSFFWRPLGGAPKGEHLARIAKSRHWNDGKFQNLVPTHMIDPGSWMRWSSPTITTTTWT